MITNSLKLMKGFTSTKGLWPGRLHMYCSEQNTRVRTQSTATHAGNRPVRRSPKRHGLGRRRSGARREGAPSSHKGAEPRAPQQAEAASATGKGRAAAPGEAAGLIHMKGRWRERGCREPGASRLINCWMVLPSGRPSRPQAGPAYFSSHRCSFTLGPMKRGAPLLNGP